MPSATWARYHKPSVKILRDKLRLILKAREYKTRSNYRATKLGGGECTRREHLLDDLILDVREFEEESHKMRDEQNENSSLRVG